MDLSSIFGQYDQAFYTMVAMWLFNAAVQALPEPDVLKPNKIYLFIFNLAHGLAANIKVLSKESAKRVQVAEIRQEFMGTGTGDGKAPTAAENKRMVKEVEKVLSEAAVAKVEAQVEASAASKLAV